jgi:hypothetical protein
VMQTFRKLPNNKPIRAASGTKGGVGIAGAEAVYRLR